MVDFYLNDIHESNFIVNPYKKTITAVDLDSSRVCSKANFASRYLTPLALLNNVKDKYKIIEDALREIEWHITTDQWDYPKSYYTGDGSEDYKVKTDIKCTKQTVQ